MESLSWHERNRDYVIAKRNTPEKKAEASARSRAWNAANQERVKNRSLLKAYGITLDEFNKMFEAQEGVCAICFQACKSGQSLCVDHNHDTKKVRGLLCKDCNNGMGRLKDNILLLQSAINYLTDRD